MLGGDVGATSRCANVRRERTQVDDHAARFATLGI